jgi:hypothetical protein
MAWSFLPGRALNLLTGDVLLFFVQEAINGAGAPIKKNTWTGWFQNMGKILTVLVYILMLASHTDAA